MNFSDRLTFVGTLLAVLGSALIAGTFFATSVFLMKALSRLPAAQGIVTMQSINVVVINPLFMTALLGTAVLGLALPVAAWRQWPLPGGGWLLAGCVLYVVGTFGVTVVFNVPLNDALAAVSPDDPAGTAVWSRYLRVWTAWNHVRMVAALAATAAFALALRRL